jgi:hypothetical protein
MHVMWCGVYGSVAMMCMGRWSLHMLVQRSTMAVMIHKNMARTCRWQWTALRIDVSDAGVVEEADDDVLASSAPKSDAASLRSSWTSGARPHRRIRRPFVRWHACRYVGHRTAN